MVRKETHRLPASEARPPRSLSALAGFLRPVFAERVDAIEILRLQERLDWGQIQDYGATGGSEILGIAKAKDVAVWGEMLLGLPDDEQMRCFLPAHGIRAKNNNEAVALILPCFHCHNGVALTASGKGSFKFDPGSEAGLKLLAAIKAFE